MLKEEKKLRNNVIGRRDSVTGEYYRPITGVRQISSLITALVRAVREDCAKVVEGCGNDELYEAIADAVRKGKPVQQCTYCGSMKDSITSNGECRTCRATHI